MEAVTIDGGQLLLASADDRVISARLVPFGEPCQSNLGRFTVDAGTLELPADASVAIMNDGHRRNVPLAAGIVYAEQADGIHASWRVAQGADGDAALRDIRDGKRTAVSVEADVTIQGGRAIAGRIFGAALVSPGKQPAFPSALLLATAAEDAVQDPEDPLVADFTTTEQLPDGSTAQTETTVEETEETDPDTGATVRTRTTTETTTITPGTPAEGGAAVPAPLNTDPNAQPLLAEQDAARVPATMLRRTPARSKATPAGVTKGQVFAMLAAAAPRSRGSQWDAALLERLRSPQVVGTLYAELSDITFDAAGSPSDMIVPQWIGELWSGRSYQRRWTPLFGTASLTSPTVKGWRWTTKPAVGKWDANKTDVPSGPVHTEPYDVEAQPFAGAHDVDRRYRDFPVPEFWDGYFSAMTESYAKQSDLYVPEQLFDADNGATTAITPDAVPTGVSPIMAAIVDGALAVLDEDLPSFAVLPKADYRALLLTKDQDNLAFLNAALGLEEGTISSFRVIPDSHPFLTTGGNAALVGCRSAATVHELPGSPIRIEGLDMARGGVDPGLFGYTAVAVHNPKALAVVRRAA